MRFSLYCINGSIEGRCTNYKNSSVCNSDCIARSVLLELFKVMCLLSIDPFMQQSEKRIIENIGGFFMTPTKCKKGSKNFSSIESIVVGYRYYRIGIDTFTIATGHSSTRSCLFYSHHLCASLRF